MVKHLNSSHLFPLNHLWRRRSFSNMQTCNWDTLISNSPKFPKKFNTVYRVFSLSIFTLPQVSELLDSCRTLTGVEANRNSSFTSTEQYWAFHIQPRFKPGILSFPSWTLSLWIMHAAAKRDTRYKCIKNNLSVPYLSAIFLLRSSGLLLRFR